MDPTVDARARPPVLPVPLLVAILVALTACAGTSSRDPFAVGEGSSAGAAAPNHFVRFEVSCDTCVIRWSVGGRGGGVRDEALWSERVAVTASAESPRTARLTAAPTAGARGVSWIRISVDGEVVAEARDESASGRERDPTGSVTVTTRVPPP